ncbi:MAG: hypothetical protein R8K20_11105, partial [Gallionellaceae bacterium]
MNKAAIALLLLATYGSSMAAPADIPNKSQAKTATKPIASQKAIVKRSASKQAARIVSPQLTGIKGLPRGGLKAGSRVVLTLEGNNLNGLTVGTMQHKGKGRLGKDALTQVTLSRATAGNQNQRRITLTIGKDSPAGEMALT